MSLLCQVEGFAGSADEVRQHAAELVSVSKERGFPFWLGLGLLHHGESLTAVGQAQEGLELLTQGLSVLRGIGKVIARSFALASLAGAHAKLGQLEEGLICLTEAVQIIERTEERFDEAHLHQVRGELLNATGDRAAAEQSYYQALAIAARQSAKTFELGAAASLARLWLDQGKRAEVRELLAPIYGWFTEGFDTPILQDAKALLDELA